MTNNNSSASFASRLWNQEMMSNRRDFNQQNPVLLRYAILSSPRSGSTLLSRALYQTRQAGDPHEYLNPAAIYAYQTGSGINLSIDAYLQEIENRRTSSNGLFGIKTHHFHLSRLGKTPEEKSRVTINFLKRQDKRILIRRRDKIAQSVSYYIAQQSGRWTTEHERYLTDGHNLTVLFDPVALSRCLQRIIEDEQSFIKILKYSNLSYMEIFFEDFIKSYNDHLMMVFEYLGLDSKIEILEPPLSTTKSNQADEIKENFLNYLYGRSC